MSSGSGTVQEGQDCALQWPSHMTCPAAAGALAQAHRQIIPLLYDMLSWQQHAGMVQPNTTNKVDTS